jgi:hypothetical protein
MKHGINLLLTFIFWVSVLFNSSAQKINQFKTENLELIYFGKRYSYLVPHAAATFNNAMSFHEALWNYKSSKTQVILNDFSDFGHGGAIVMPFNQVFLGLEPYSFAFSIIPSNERFQWLFNHELTHVAMAEKATERDERWRALLSGKVRRNEKWPLTALWSYLTVPRWYAPRWFHEGIACFMETWMSGGLGRAMGNYDEMYFRSIVAEKLPIYSLVGLETEGTVIDFQVGANAYLYGTRFVTYLADQYGIDKLKAFYTRSDDSRSFFASQFKKTYNVPIRKEWNKWIEWENNFQQKNIDEVSKYPLTSFSPITSKSLGNVSRFGYNPLTGKMYAAINHPGIISQIAEIDRKDGSIRKLCTLDSPSLYYSTHLAYDPGDEKIFISEQNNNFRSLVQIDAKSGKKKAKIRFSRTGDLVFNPLDKSIWGVKHDNGYAVLVKIPYPYDKILPMFTVEFGKAIFDPDISHDGKLLSASLSGVKGEQSLILFNLEQLESGKKSYNTVYQLEDNTLTQFKFSNDDKYLIGTSYYTGVSNIWRLEIETEKFELLSNSETGFFMPVQIGSDSLIVLKFTRDGMIPGIIPMKVINDANSIEFLGNRVHQKNPEVEKWSLPAAKQNPDTASFREGDYHIFRNMRLANAYPDIAGFKKTVAAGLRLNWLDPLGISDLNLFLAGSPWSDYKGKQKLHVQLDWKYWNWNLLASYNKTDFYDLFGPTLRSRAGYTLGLTYSRTYSLRSPFKVNYDAGIYTYGDLEVIPQYQNVTTPVRNFQAASASFGVAKVRKTLGGVDDEKGYRWEVSSTSYLAQKKFYPSVVSEQSAGFLLPGLRNTSFWIRNSIGQSFGDSSSALSKFYFGGFRNNYVDWQPSEQYRELTAFAGSKIDEIPARNFLKTMGELNLKPLRLRNVGTSWLYPTFVKTSFFSTYLISDFSNKELSRNIFNFGTQMDIQLVLFSYMKTTWSVGYAVKTEKAMKNQSQFMLSLKLLGN